MQYVDDPEVLLLVLGLLVAPMLFAFPAQHYWRKRISPQKKHREYRKMVAGVLNHGHPLELFRPSLDKAGRRNGLSIEEQGRIESDILYPMRLLHFLLLPSMILWPILSLVAVFLILPLLPLLRLTEWILIDKGGLTGIVRTIKRLTEWQLIGVPKLDRGAHGGDAWIKGLHRMPTTVFLGLFAYLVVHYLHLPDNIALALAAGIYLILACLAIITSVAIDSALAFADNAKRRLLPLEAIMQDLLTPVVGVGLLLLLSRQGFLTLTNPGEGLHEPVLFAISMMVVIYTCTIVAALIEWAANRRREHIRGVFHEQIIALEKPELYSYTRDRDGSLSLRYICTLREFVDNDHGFPEQSQEASIRFEDLMALPSLVEEGLVTLPPEKPKRNSEH